VRARHAWVAIGGTRSVSYLLVWGSQPLLSHSTDPDNVPDEHVFLLGVAHHQCVGKARQQLEAGQVVLPDNLPILQIETGSDVPPVRYTLYRQCRQHARFAIPRAT